MRDLGILKKFVIVLSCLVTPLLSFACAPPSNTSSPTNDFTSVSASTTTQNIFTSADELVAEINRLSSDINSYEYNCRANGYRLLEDGLELSNQIITIVLIEKDKNRGMIEASTLTTVHSADEQEETETRLQSTYIDGKSVYYGESVQGDPIDYVVEPNASGALGYADILKQQLKFLKSSEVTLLPDTDRVKGIDCYVLELNVDTETLLNVTIIPSFWEVMTFSSQDISIFLPYVNECSYIYWVSKDYLHLVKIHQYLELSSKEPGNQFNITYEWNHEFSSYNENLDITIPFETSEVVIQDSLLAQGIREALDKEGGVITTQDLATLTELDVGHYGISSFAGLEYCVNLEYLAISHYGDNLDISPLSGLTKLHTLKLSSIPGNTDLTPVSNLVKLTSLEISTSDPIDISPILNLPNITELELDWDTSLDIRQLETFLKLESLTLHADGDITDLTPLINLNINKLYLSSRGITDVSPLTQLDNLKSLTIYASHLVDISPLSRLHQLEYLNLEINNDADFTPLSNLLSLKSLQLSSHNLNDISFLSGLVNLESLILDRNDIVDITPLSGLTNLTKLEINSNDITDLSPLSGLIKLESLDISYAETSDIEPLASLTALKELTMYGNDINDISIIVNFQNLQVLNIGGNNIVDISPLRNLYDLQYLVIINNPVTDITPLVENTGLGEGDEVTLDEDYMNTAIEESIKILEGRGVIVNVR